MQPAHVDRFLDGEFVKWPFSDTVQRTFADALLSTSARLAVGLGLKGVLPFTGWAGLNGFAPSELLPVRVPRSRKDAGLDVCLNSMRSGARVARWRS